MNPTRPRAAFVVLLAAVVVSLIGPLVPQASAQASAQAADVGRVRGAIAQSGGGTPKVTLSWFSASWQYLGRRQVTGGAYSLALPPGTYWLQFTDRRPAYDVKKARPTDIKVTVRAGATSVKSVRMRRGDAIGGTVRADGKPARGARIVAANTQEQSFETTANSAGQYALGGLPPGKYSVFTYDRAKRWVAKSTYLGTVSGGKFRTVDVRLAKRAGTLLVDLYAGTKPYAGTAYVTAVSRATGQFWTAKAQHGSVTFAGLYPGRYTLQVPGVGNYLPARLSTRARVRSGKAAFGSVRLVKQGGSIAGRVVGANNTSTGLSGATVRLFDAKGGQVDSATTGSTGAFTLGGQLLTQRGMTVVVGRGPYSKYLGGCIYDAVRVAGVAVAVQQRTALGSVVMPLSDDPEQPGQCLPPPPPRTSASLEGSTGRS